MLGKFGILVAILIMVLLFYLVISFGAGSFSKKEKKPENEYALIMGADNLQNFHKWKNYKQILADYSIYVYPRSGIEISGKHKNIHIVKGVPQMEISASFIRKSIKQKKDVSYLIPEKAWKYIDEMNFYK